MACCHKKPVSLESPETDIGTLFWEIYTPDWRPVWTQYQNAIDVFTSRPTAPEITIYIASKSVRTFGWSCSKEGSAIRKLRAVGDNVINADSRQVVVDYIHLS